MPRLDKDTVRRANPVERLISELLGEHALDVGGELKVRCPWHEDKHPSLRINPAKQVWHCDPCNCGGDVFAFVQKFRGCDFPAALTWLADRSGSIVRTIRPEDRREVAAYDYRDETGALLYQVVRFEPKGFRQRRPDAAGGWTWNLNGSRRVVYRLPELHGREGILIVEGEKDADRAWLLDLPATCNAGGAGKWSDEYSRQLAAAGVTRVRIIPDHDPAGREHATAVARSCLTTGLDVKIVTLPEVPDKGDLSDYLATHSKEELIALIQAAPAFVPTPPGTAASLQFTALGDLLAEPDEAIEWVVEDRIPRGSLCLLAGKPKAGKSTLARVGALQVASGGRWLGWACTPGPVWYLAFEDKRSEIRKHFRKMGATGWEAVRFFFPQRVDDLLRQLHAQAEQERPFLIIVDTLQRLIGARDLNDYAEVTTKITPLLHLARETGAAVLLVHHAGKGERAGIDSVLGSTALAGSVDNILICTRSERYRLLSSIQRVGPDLAEAVLLLDEETGRVTLGGCRHDADVADMKTAMVAALGENREPLAERDLEKLVEGRATVKRDALRGLVGEGKVVRDGAGRRGNPYVYRVSPTLVPLYIREQETEKPKIAKTTDEMGLDSRSRDLAASQPSLTSSEQESDLAGGAVGRARVRF